MPNLPFTQTHHRSATFVVLALALWFARDMAWSTVHFPFNWYGFVVLAGVVLGCLWLMRFRAWALVVLATIGIALDPRMLIQFFSIDQVRSHYFYLNLLLSVIDVAWVALAVASLATLRLNNVAKWLLIVPFAALLVLMVGYPHYRWV